MSLLSRNVPMLCRQSSYFDNYFRNMDADMRARETEMAQMITQMRQQMFQLMPRRPSSMDLQSAELESNHPIVEDKGQVKLRLQFNVEKFNPEEVKVQVQGDNILNVHAKHEEKSDTGYSVREYFRQYTLPKGVEADKMKSELTTDGILIVEAPAPSLKDQAKMIPIEYKP